MSKKLLHLATLFAIIGIAILQLNYSSNPPIDRTNRNSGSNCTQCHSGSLNPVGGSLSLTGTSSYYPGKVYTIGVAVTGGSVHGFEMTAVRSTATSTAGGTFSGSGFNVTTSNGLSYARHSPKTAAGTWSVSWTAPSTNVGSVTLYAAGVAANNNSSTSGDKTYASTKQISALDKITFTATATSNQCNGGSDGKIKITGVAGGAGAPYSYAWSGSTSTADSLVNLQAGNYTVTVSDKDNNSETKVVNVGQPNPIAANKSTENTICGLSTGKAWLSPSGGTGPFSIQWATGITTSSDTAINLAFGTYSVTITDSKMCSIVDSVSILNGASNIILSMGTNPEYCGNQWGEAFVSQVSNGIGSVTYAWNNNKTGDRIDSLAAGQYMVTVTDSLGCTATSSVMVVSATNTITATTMKEDDACNKGVGYMKVNSPSGGKAPYSYLWSNQMTGDSIGGLIAGVYSLTITDSLQCTTTLKDTLSDQAAPMVSISSDSAKCFGDSSGSASVNTSRGVAPYSYSWSNGSSDSLNSNIAAGKYIVTVSDANNCVTIDSVEILQPTAISISKLLQSTDNPALCDEQAEIELMGGTPQYTINWNDKNNSTGLVVSNLCAGVLIATITDKNGCVSDSSITIVDRDITSVLEFHKPTVRLYPNPAFKFLSIEGIEGTYQMLLMSVSGEVVLSKEGVNNTTLDLEGLDKGMYFLELQPTDGERTSRKVIVQ